MWWNNCKVRETNYENYTILDLLKRTYNFINQIPHLYFTIYYFAKCITMKKWIVFQMKLALVVIILIVLLVIISKSNNTFKPYFIIIFHFKCNFFGPFQGYKKYLLKSILITWGQFFFYTKWWPSQSIWCIGFNINGVAYYYIMIFIIDLMIFKMNSNLNCEQIHA